VLLVGINPGVRSAVTGHHFAGYSNRFWKLLYESGLVPEAIRSIDDERLPEWGLGVTNLVARPTPSIDDLKPAEYAEGWTILERKIERHKPKVVAFVGVTVYRAVLPLIDPAARRGSGRLAPDVVVGLRPQVIHGARLYVLPNPSGRNANFTYAEMLDAFQGLREYLELRDEQVV
jgi:double-stranded uracil-DNA glycosylase